MVMRYEVIRRRWTRRFWIKMHVFRLLSVKQTQNVDKRQRNKNYMSSIKKV